MICPKNLPSWSTKEYNTKLAWFIDWIDWLIDRASLHFSSLSQNNTNMPEPEMMLKTFVHSILDVTRSYPDGVFTLFLSQNVLSLLLSLHHSSENASTAPLHLDSIWMHFLHFLYTFESPSWTHKQILPIVQSVSIKALKTDFLNQLLTVRDGVLQEHIIFDQIWKGFGYFTWRISVFPFFSEFLSLFCSGLGTYWRV